jgi:hypothetical protein
MSAVAQFTYQIIGNKEFVYISVYDSVTGQLTNGNNMIVVYTRTENGIPTTLSVTIPGQSVEIWTENLGANTSFSIVSQTGGGGNQPPVNKCDLVISSVNIDKPESSIGAHDAQATVSATSSYLPIQYSIDDSNWQTSPTFTGLPGGLVTFFCKDANTLGCVADKSVTIQTTANLLVSDPSVTINGNTSRWNAAFNPIVFTYQRKDFEATAVTMDSLTGNAKVAVNGDMSFVAATYTNNQAIQQNAAAQALYC